MINIRVCRPATSGKPTLDEQQAVDKLAESYDGLLEGYTNKGPIFSFEHGPNARAFADKINRTTAFRADEYASI